MFVYPHFQVFFFEFPEINLCTALSILLHDYKCVEGRNIWIFGTTIAKIVIAFSLQHTLRTYTVESARIAKIYINTQSGLRQTNKCTIDVQRYYCAYKLLAINEQIKIDVSTSIRMLHATEHAELLRLGAHLPHYLKINFCLKNISLLTLNVFVSICGLFHAGMQFDRCSSFGLYIWSKLWITCEFHTTSYWWLCSCRCLRCRCRRLLDIDFANTNNINFDRCSHSDICKQPKSIDDGRKTRYRYACAPTLFG